jgi:hypothetical protein
MTKSDSRVIGTELARNVSVRWGRPGAHSLGPGSASERSAFGPVQAPAFFRRALAPENIREYRWPHPPVYAWRITAGNRNSAGQCRPSSGRMTVKNRPPLMDENALELVHRLLKR